MSLKFFPRTNINPRVENESGRASALFFFLPSFHIPSLPIRRERSANVLGMPLWRRRIFGRLWLINALVPPTIDLQIFTPINGIRHYKTIRG